MSDIQLAKRFSYNISDIFLITTGLLLKQWTQSLDIWTQAFWLTMNNLSECAQEHVLLLSFNLIHNVEDFLQEESCVSNGDATK